MNSKDGTSKTTFMRCYTRAYKNLYKCHTDTESHIYGNLPEKRLSESKGTFKKVYSDKKAYSKVNSNENIY